MSTADNLKKRLSLAQIFTIPNIISMFRIVLILPMCWLYIGKGNSIGAGIILAVSGISDILDGWVARKFHMVSDLGKVLDPISDKLTQGAIVICLAIRFPLIIVFLVTFAVTELLKFYFGYLCLKKKDSVNSANWYGKVNTVVVFGIMAALMLFPQMESGISNGLIVTMTLTNAVCFALYAKFYYDIFRKQEDE